MNDHSSKKGPLAEPIPMTFVLDGEETTLNVVDAEWNGSRLWIRTAQGREYTFDSNGVQSR